MQWHFNTPKAESLRYFTSPLQKQKIRQSSSLLKVLNICNWSTLNKLIIKPSTFLLKKDAVAGVFIRIYEIFPNRFCKAHFRTTASIIAGICFKSLFVFLNLLCFIGLMTLVELLENWMKLNICMARRSEKITTFLRTKYFFDAASSCFCRHEILLCATSTFCCWHEILFFATSARFCRHQITFFSNYAIFPEDFPMRDSVDFKISFQ